MTWNHKTLHAKTAAYTLSEKKKFHVIPLNSSGSVRVQNLTFRFKDGVVEILVSFYWHLCTNMCHIEHQILSLSSGLLVHLLACLLPCSFAGLLTCWESVNVQASIQSYSSHRANLCIRRLHLPNVYNCDCPILHKGTQRCCFPVHCILYHP